MTMSEEKTNEWHFHTAAMGQTGPVRLADLQSLVRNGQVGPSDLVWTSTMTAWMPASQVLELFAAPSAAPGAVPAVSAASVTPASLAPPIPPAGGNYLVRHWRGDLPLGISFWVNGFLLYFAVKLAAVGIFAAMASSGSSAAIVIAVIGVLVLGLSFQVWSLVGIWRSADRHESRGGQAIWALLARAAVVIICLLIVASIFGGLSGARY
jgi:hypothetical protein